MTKNNLLLANETTGSQHMKQKPCLPLVKLQLPLAKYQAKCESLFTDFGYFARWPAEW